jgi:hypothetical protein
MQNFIQVARMAGFATLLVLPVSAIAQENDIEAFGKAVESGVCGDIGVAKAYYAEPLKIMVECNDAAAFRPLGGGMGSAGAIGLGLVLVAMGAGGSTGSTNGTP